MRTVRVQVILSLEDRERFRREAMRQGLSLSAWIRQEAEKGLASAASRQVPGSADELQAFFDACDERESGQGPDWTDHRRAIDESTRSGANST